VSQGFFLITDPFLSSGSLAMIQRSKMCGNRNNQSVNILASTISRIIFPLIQFQRSLQRVDPLTCLIKNPKLDYVLTLFYSPKRHLLGQLPCITYFTQTLITGSAAREIESATIVAIAALGSRCAPHSYDLNPHMTSGIVKTADISCYYSWPVSPP
jgi:hypothetical protein